MTTTRHTHWTPAQLRRILEEHVRRARLVREDCGRDALVARAEAALASFVRHEPAIALRTSLVDLRPLVTGCAACRDRASRLTRQRQLGRRFQPPWLRACAEHAATTNAFHETYDVETGAPA